MNEKSVDDLLAELERLRARKAEVEKKEQELTAALRKKLQTQTERLQKLGVAPKDTTHAEPDRVGRIIIEGNTKTPDKKILENLDIRPGQLLRYPALEAARAKLEKAGFAGTTIEIVASESDLKFKDIRIRVNEPGPGAAAPRPQP